MLCISNVTLIIIINSFCVISDALHHVCTIIVQDLVVKEMFTLKKENFVENFKLQEWKGITLLVLTGVTCHIKKLECIVGLLHVLKENI